MNVLNPKDLPIDEKVMWEWTSKNSAKFGAMLVKTLLHKLHGVEVGAAVPLKRLDDLLTVYPKGAGDNPYAWSSYAHDDAVNEAYRRGLKDAAAGRFGVGPHLLTAKDGSFRARGGPGVCPVCDTTDGAWRPIVPSLPGLYWFKNNQGQAVVTHNAGREFTFIGTDEAMSPEAMVEDGGKFWSKPLTPPELD